MTGGPAPDDGLVLIPNMGLTTNQQIRVVALDAAVRTAAAAVADGRVSDNAWVSDMTLRFANRYAAWINTGKDPGATR